MRLYRVRLWGLEWDYDCDTAAPPKECVVDVNAASELAAESAAYAAAESRFGAVIDSGWGNFEILAIEGR